KQRPALRGERCCLRVGGTPPAEAPRQAPERSRSTGSAWEGNAPAPSLSFDSLRRGRGRRSAARERRPNVAQQACNARIVRPQASGLLCSPIRLLVIAPPPENVGEAQEDTCVVHVKKRLSL